MDDITGIITNFNSDDFKIFRLVSKRFSKISLCSVTLSSDDTLWLCKMYIIHKKNVEEIKKHVLMVKDSLLIWTLINRNLSAVQHLITIGANVHADNDFALRYASRSGYEDVVRCLITNGANVHADDEFALRWASCFGHLNVVQLLITNGANVRAGGGYALCYYAFKNGHEDIVQYLKLAMANESSANKK